MDVDRESDIDVYELEKKVGDIERKFDEGHLNQ